MMLVACVLCEMDASKVKLSPCLTCLPTARQLFVQERLPAVLLQGVDLVGDCLHSIQEACCLHMQQDRIGQQAALTPNMRGRF